MVRALSLIFLALVCACTVDRPFSLADFACEQGGPCAPDATPRDAGALDTGAQTDATPQTDAAQATPDAEAPDAAPIVPAPRDLSYDSPQVYRSGFAIAPLTPTVVGSVLSWSIAPSLGARTGLSFDATSGVISGIPSVISRPIDYRVTATNASGSATAFVSIGVDDVEFDVNSLADEDDEAPGDGRCSALLPGNLHACTLRAAMDETMSSLPAARHLIRVPAGTIRLAIPVCGRSFDVVGAGRDATVIEAANGDGIFDCGNSPAAGDVAFEKLSMQGAARAILTQSGDGALYLSKVAFRHNSDGIAKQGPGPLVITECLFESNTAPMGGAALTIYSSSSSSITRSVFNDNVAVGALGGAIVQGRTGLLHVADTSFSRNSARGGGAIFSVGPLTVSRVLFADNEATGVAGSPNPRGGALLCVGNCVAALTNSTITGRSGSGGNAVFCDASSSVSLRFCTIAGNRTPLASAPAVTGAAITVESCILANNTDGSGSASCAPEVRSLGHNISDTAATDCQLSGVGDLISTDPRLGPLASHGGPTQTMPLLSGSAALDAAQGSACPPTDQRGVARPMGPACDIGAFEAP